MEEAIKLPLRAESVVVSHIIPFLLAPDEAVGCEDSWKKNPFNAETFGITTGSSAKPK